MGMNTIIFLQQKISETSLELREAKEEVEGQVEAIEALRAQVREAQDLQLSLQSKRGRALATLLGA